MKKSIKELVNTRAKGSCEYCLLPELISVVPFQTEHIIPKKHGGETKLSNLCLACHRCNLCKSSNLTGIDYLTKRLARIFNPRKMKWHRHFRWNGALIIGRTPIGRATITVLNMNDRDRVNLRLSLIEEGAIDSE